jgi:hypothetical protein
VKNLQKPAPTQPIIYIYFDWDKISYGRTLTQETGFFTKSVAVTHLLGKNPVSGYPCISPKIVHYRQILYVKLALGWGRVYYIVGFRQLLSVKPAPTRWGRVYYIVGFRQLLSVKLALGWGRVYYIVGFRQLLSVKPAPTSR